MPGDGLERRFGGLRRLYGDVGYRQLRALRVAVIGLGGVGSWAVEALARSGVAELVLIDMDHVAESNINRQVQALSSTLGQAKGEALRARAAEIHPECVVHVVDDFVTPENWPAILPVPIDAVIDACDQTRTKVSLAAWARREAIHFVCVGAAGGKKRAHAVEVGDLAAVSHDPLLASVRQRLRRDHAAPRQGNIGVDCVFSCETVDSPDPQSCEVDGTLNCHGYGSSVMVTASFGFAAAARIIERTIQSNGRARM